MPVAPGLLLGSAALISHPVLDLIHLRRRKWFAGLRIACMGSQLRAEEHFRRIIDQRSLHARNENVAIEKLVREGKPGVAIDLSEKLISIESRVMGTPLVERQQGLDVDGLTIHDWDYRRRLVLSGRP